MAFNQKNPPWQRNAGHQSISNMQAIVSFPQAQPVYNPNIGLQQQQNISILPQMGIQQQQAIYSQTVQYPTSRPINALGYQNQPQSQPSQSPVNQNSSKFNPNNRVFSGTGMVTKLQTDFGFIDDEVFFHKNTCVKGIIPKVGDRVLVDAAYNTNMPFKWNASRVQLLQSSNANSSSVAHVNSSQVRSHAPMYNNAPSSSSESRSSVRNRYSPLPRKSPERHMPRSSNSRSKDEYDDSERRRKRDDRDSDRPIFREKHRERSAERGRERERSPLRKQSPKRRRVRSVPRYMVQVPKHLLTIKNADVLEVRRRYTNLYIPSDFFISDIRWTEAFPPDAPLSIRSPCHFHVMHKDVEPPPTGAPGAGPEASLDPPDANYLYSVKVMLLSTPPMSEFYEKCIAKGGTDADRHDEERDNMHPTRLISFLVGMRGKNETMAIGGPWSPSLDGADPHADPTVLMRTAVRTCRALTGIDLSGCSQWYRFVELYYRRSESYHKGRLIPPRVETVVIFLPDVRSCQPTRLEWEQLRLSYKASLARVINSGSSSDGGGGGTVDAAPSGTDSPAGGPAASAPISDDVTKPSSGTPSAVAPSSIAASPAVAGVAVPAAVSAAVSAAAATAAATAAAAAAAEAAAAGAAATATAAAAAAVVPEAEKESSSAPVGVAAAAAAAADVAAALESASDTSTSAPPSSSSSSSSPSAAAAAAAAASSVGPPAPEEKDSHAPATRSGSVTGSSNSNSNSTAGPAAASAAVSIMDTTEGLSVSETATDLLLEYKKMKVVELKAELSNRGLPIDGVKAVLLARLSDAIVKEQQEMQQKALQQAQRTEEVKQEEPAAEDDAPMDEPAAPAPKQEVNADGEMAEALPVPVKQEIKGEPMDESAPKAPVVGADEGSDGTKGDGKAASVAPRKKEEPVKLSEKERHALERRYQLPDKSHIVVHPSRVAKSGKFDCAVISLSVLLDYRPEDTKEHSFEVALFAEVFNEMLTRDFGFNIYQALCMLPPAKKELDEGRKEGAAGDGGSKGGGGALVGTVSSSSSSLEMSVATSNGEAEGGARTTATTTTTTTSSTGGSEKGEELKRKGRDGDDKEPRNDRKRARQSEHMDDERRSKDKDAGGKGAATAAAAATAPLVVNCDLLLSFAYFDVTHCGYIAEKDVEDLIYTLGLNLSRSQIRKTVAKATVRDLLHYRKLTDRAPPALAPSPSADDASGETSVASASDKPADKDAVELPPVDDSYGSAERGDDSTLRQDTARAVARGNTDYKQQLKASLEQHLVHAEGDHHGTPQPSSDTSASVSTSIATVAGIVEYNGCVVDVGKLLEQVKRTEAAREEAEKMLAALHTQHAKVVSSNTRATSRIKDLQSETKTLGRQLSESMRTSREATQTSADYLAAIQQVYERVRPIVLKPNRDGTSKRGSSKEQSSRVTTSKSRDKECTTGKDAAGRKEDEQRSAKEKSDLAKAAGSTTTTPTITISSDDTSGESVICTLPPTKGDDHALPVECTVAADTTPSTPDGAGEQPEAS